MKLFKSIRITFLTAIVVLFATGFAVAQAKPEILAGDTLKTIVPAGFYFAGQSAETQMRNSAAAKIGENRFIIVGLVDTSGYSTEISGQYEGFLITDSNITIGGKKLATGAYGFGFSKDRVNVFDLSSKLILSAPIKSDPDLRRPRPVMLTADNKSVRLYKGKSYALITYK